MEALLIALVDTEYWLGFYAIAVLMHYGPTLIVNNLLAVGFDHKGESADLVTAFEALEHFINPTSRE